MNLLVITNNPGRASFRQRIGIYLDTLQNNGIKCRVEKLPVGELGRFSLFKKAKEFDAVLLHKKRLNCIDAFFLHKAGTRIIYDFDDAVMYNENHPDKPSRRRIKLFARTITMADTVTAGNSYLAQQAKKYNRNVHILPTGLDVKKYDISTQRQSDGKIRLVWIGSKSTLGYIKELSEVFGKIGQRNPNVVLRLISDKFFEPAGMPVEKIFWSLETEAADLASSDIGLAPLPDNLFTRGKCGFKILQYQAAALPVVTSPVGVNTEYVKDGKTGFYANKIEEWIDKISTLIENEHLRQEVGLAGRIFVQRFDYKVLGNQLVELIKT